MGIQDLTLPFIKKEDLEKKKEEMKQSIGMLSKQKEEEKLHALELEAETKKEAKAGTQQLEVPKQVKEEKAQKEKVKEEVEEKASEEEKKEVIEIPEIFKKPLPTFYFWYCDLKASNLLEFEEAVRKAPLESLHHHASNHDFSKWLEKSMPNSFIVKLKDAEEKSNNALRNAILEALELLKKRQEPQSSKKQEANLEKGKQEQKSAEKAEKELKEPVVASL